jgi:hypothetical protein
MQSFQELVQSRLKDFLKERFGGCDISNAGSCIGKEFLSSLPDFVNMALSDSFLRS